MPDPLPILCFNEETVDLTQMPTDCDPFGSYPGQAPKLGDAHGCLQKMIWFFFKTGLARFDPEWLDSKPEDVYSLMHQIAELTTLPNLRARLVPLNLAQALEQYEGLISCMCDYLDNLEFHQNMIVVFFGDLFMERNGNETFTAMIFKRIQVCGGRSIITLSNHDAKFIKRLIEPNANQEPDNFMNSVGQSTAAFETLVSYNLASREHLWECLNDGYFKNLVAFYYEIGPEGEIENICSHAPNGEKEILEMVHGLAYYSAQQEHACLFTEDQKTRLTEMYAIQFDANKGLSDAELRSCLDLMNEIIHTNAIKADKKDLCSLIGLGTELFTSQQLSGYGIPATLAPFYRLIWNRDCPAPQPIEGKRRQFINGHDDADLESHPDHLVWYHNNITLDDRAGKTANLMKGQKMRYLLPVPGYNPMPPVTVAQSRPLRHSRPPTPEDSSSFPAPITGNKRQNPF